MTAVETAHSLVQMEEVPSPPSPGRAPTAGLLIVCTEVGANIEEAGSRRSAVRETGGSEGVPSPLPARLPLPVPLPITLALPKALPVPLPESRPDEVLSRDPSPEPVRAMVICLHIDV